MFYILLALREERCGVDIMAAVEELSRGRIRVGPGTLYAMLPKFENAGIIRQTRQEGRQKWYAATAQGLSMLDEEIARLKVMLGDAERALEAGRQA